jgi:hypothetical protein
MWESGIPGRRKEAFNMLSEILKVGQGVINETMLKEASDTHRKWATYEDLLEPIQEED